MTFPASVITKFKNTSLLGAFHLTAFLAIGRKVFSVCISFTKLSKPKTSKSSTI